MRKGIFQQRLIVLSGGTTGEELPEDMEFWTDTAGARALVISTKIVHLSTGTVLKLQTGSTENGPWTSVDISSAGTAVTVFEASSGATNKLERFVRWNVVGGTGPWEICFSASGATSL